MVIVIRIINKFPKREKWAIFAFHQEHMYNVIHSKGAIIYVEFFVWR